MRIAVSEQFHAPPGDVRRWRTSDLIAAHAVLDAIEADQRLATARREARRK